MNDLFEDIWHSMQLSEDMFRVWIELRRSHPNSDFAKREVRGHLDFVLASLNGRHASWNEAWRYSRRIIDFMGPLLNDDERAELEAAAKAFRDRTNDVDRSRGRCVVCGELADGKHKCDRPERDRQDRAGVHRGQTESDRIAEGFRMLQEMEETA